MGYDTIVFKEEYKDLNTTLYWLVQQALTSIPYCIEKWGNKNSIEEIFVIGSQNLKYKNDKKGIEQIQSVGTMMENNIHGIPGAGDCDCFSTFLIAMLLANGYNSNDVYIYLQGRTKKFPSHILIMYKSKGNPIYMDLTEKHLGQKRSYKFYDIIPINLYL